MLDANSKTIRGQGVAPKIGSARERALAQKALYAAARAGDIGAIRAALAGGANVNQLEGCASPGPRGRGQKSALDCAFAAGHVVAASYLIDQGATLDESLLEVAASLGRADFLRLFVDRGAPRHRSKQALLVALTVSPELRRLEIVQALVEVDSGVATLPLVIRTRSAPETLDPVVVAAAYVWPEALRLIVDATLGSGLRARLNRAFLETSQTRGTVEARNATRALLVELLLSDEIS